MKIPRPLINAWIALIVLSLATTALSIAGSDKTWVPVTGTAILLIAWIKARLVLARYMGLAAAPSWQGGFDICLGIFVLVLGGLYLAPAFI